MIESYNLNETMSKFEDTLHVLGQGAYYTAISILVIWLIINIFVWRFGANKQSEKLTKSGIRNCIMSLILLVITFVVPGIIALIKFIAAKYGI